MKSSGLVLLVFFSNIHTAVLDPIVIQKQAEIIEKKIMRDRYIFYGLTAVAIAYQVSTALSQFKNAYDTKSTPRTETPSEEKLSILQSIAQSFKESFKACKAGLHHLVFTQEGWIATTHVFVGFGSSVVISKLTEKFMRPDTLRWYVRTHVPYHITLKMMKTRLEELQDASLDQDQVCMGHEYIQLLYERLVKQVSLISSYMLYKEKYLDDEERAIVQRLRKLIFNSQNSWLERIKNQLSAEDRDYEEIMKLIIAYEADCKLQINHFSLVEGDTPYERDALQKQIEDTFGAINKSN
jgi:hypothetical protein